jgi:Tetratricopeptide repeat
MAHGDVQPEVATDLNKSGTLCAYMGQIDEARSLLAQAIDLREKLLGKEHPYTIQSRQGLEYLQHPPTQSPEA